MQKWGLTHVYQVLTGIALVYEEGMSIVYYQMDHTMFLSQDRNYEPQTK